MDGLFFPRLYILENIEDNRVDFYISGMLSYNSCINSVCKSFYGRAALSYEWNSLKIREIQDKLIKFICSITEMVDESFILLNDIH